jgi:hypothetical protein
MPSKGGTVSPVDETAAVYDNGKSATWRQGDPGTMQYRLSGYSRGWKREYGFLYLHPNKRPSEHASHLLSAGGLKPVTRAFEIAISVSTQGCFTCNRQCFTASLPKAPDQGAVCSAWRLSSWRHRDGVEIHLGGPRIQCSLSAVIRGPHMGKRDGQYDLPGVGYLAFFTANPWTGNQVTPVHYHTTNVSLR